MVSEKYYTMGLTIVFYTKHRYSVSLEFRDGGHCQSDSTEGELYCRYIVDDLDNAIDTLVADAKKLGIEFRDPAIYIKGDGENKEDFYPSNWREIVANQCKRLNWHNIYHRQ